MTRLVPSLGRLIQLKVLLGLFGLDHIVHFTHVVESLLDMLRNEEIAVSTLRLIAVLLPCRDHIGSLD